MSDSSSEDENLAKFKESAVTMNDLQKETTLTKARMSNTGRNIEVIDKNCDDPEDTGITPEFQDYISKKLEKLLEK